MRYGLGLFLLAMLGASAALAQTSKRAAAAAGGIAAANVNRQHLHPRLRFDRYVLLEFVCGARHRHGAGQSAMQSQLHYVAARLQATMLMVPRSKPALHGVA